jgi:predicted CXXCH cytochrome family protein
MAVGATWLFLAAIPALADGGPHVVVINDGSLGINADSCAGCHRAHTAQGPMLINAEDEEALCLTCHGSGGVGSTVDVMTGVQYKVALPPGSAPQDPSDPTVLLGALRNGGFDKARIGSDAVYRIITGSGALRTKVPVSTTSRDVTSSHIGMATEYAIPGDPTSAVLFEGNDLTMPGIAWGNSDGTFSATPFAGPAVADLSCANCHNPHGNGQFRILVPIPTANDANPDPDVPDFIPDTAENPVTDAPLDNPADADTDPDVRNYTVIQTVATSPVLFAESVIAAGFPPTAGDYFHRGVPWNTRTNSDAPNGQPGTFNGQMIAWCSACHTRYDADSSDATSDGVFTHRHFTAGSVACTTCHVTHGTNAAMGGTNSASMPYPNRDIPGSAAGVDNGNGRLLKIDNRGTCQACHDPTGTNPTPVGPLPVPFTP